MLMMTDPPAPTRPPLPPLAPESCAQLRALAQAMRHGATLRPQAGNTLFGIPFDFALCEQIGSCALGSVYEAVYGTFDLTDHATKMTLLSQRFPVLNLEVYSPIKAEQYIPASLRFQITRLNDEHHWTREQIANWVASLAL